MRRYFNKRAQAMMEMAILGTVVLMAFGALVTYIAKLNGDQYQLMQAFRKALKHSHDDNKIVAYGTWDDRRQADVSRPIVGKKTTSSGAGYVMWAIPSVEDQGEDPEKTLYMGINALGGRFGMPIEYDLGEQQPSGGIAPSYVTIIGEGVSVQANGGRASTSRHAGVGEVMIYEIGEQTTRVQARGHGR